MHFVCVEQQCNVMVCALKRGCTHGVYINSLYCAPVKRESPERRCLKIVNGSCFIENQNEYWILFMEKIQRYFKNRTKMSNGITLKISIPNMCIANIFVKFPEWCLGAFLNPSIFRNTKMLHWQMLHRVV